MGVRIAIAGVSLGLAVSVAGGCDPPAFACSSDAQCGVGLCEVEGFCSFADSSCVLGRRFGVHAEQWAGRCVPEHGGDEGGLADDDGGAGDPAGDGDDDGGDGDGDGDDAGVEAGGATVAWTVDLGVSTVSAAAAVPGGGVAVTGVIEDGAARGALKLVGPYVAQVSADGVDWSVPLSSTATLLPSAVAAEADGTFAVAGNYGGAGGLWSSVLPFGGTGFVAVGSERGGMAVPLSGAPVLRALTLDEGIAYAAGWSPIGMTTILGGAVEPYPSFLVGVSEGWAQSWTRVGDEDTLLRPRAVAVSSTGVAIAGDAGTLDGAAVGPEAFVLGAGSAARIAGDEPHSISAAVTAPDGALVLAGSFGGAFALDETLEAHGELDTFVARVELDGSVGWVARIGGAGRATPSAIAVGSDGAIALIGDAVGDLELDGELRALPGSAAAFVARIDEAGALGWLAVVGSDGFDRGIGVGFDGDDIAAVVDTGAALRVDDVVVEDEAGVRLVGLRAGEG